MNDDHDAWLASLAGRPGTDDKEAAMLRRIMLDADPRQAGQDNLDHDWQRLRFALRREARRERPAWFDRAVFAQAAMFLVVLAGVALMAPPERTPGLASDGGDGVIMRGKFNQEVAAADPAAAAADLAGRLRALGVAVELKSKPELTELRVRLIHPVAPPVRALFAGEQIELPGHGDLHVLFVPAVR